MFFIILALFSASFEKYCSENVIVIKKNYKQIEKLKPSALKLLIDLLFSNIAISEYIISCNINVYYVFVATTRLVFRNHVCIGVNGGSALVRRFAIDRSR